MIPSKEKEGRYYLLVRQLSALLLIKASENNDDFYCLNCLHCFRTENKLKSHEKVCKKRFLWNCNANKKE